MNYNHIGVEGGTLLCCTNFKVFRMKTKTYVPSMVATSPLISTQNIFSCEYMSLGHTRDIEGLYEQLTFFKKSDISINVALIYHSGPRSTDNQALGRHQSDEC